MLPSPQFSILSTQDKKSILEKLFVGHSLHCLEFIARKQPFPQADAFAKQVEWFTDAIGFDNSHLSH